MPKEILINQLFAGKYLEEGENIGHEVINLFRDDHGNHNIFVTPSGRVSGHDLDYILFVRNVSARRTVEVVGLAKDIRDFENEEVKNEEIKNARYAGVSLDQVFKKNIYHGGTDLFTQHITFRAGQFLLPTCRILITLDNNEYSEEYKIIHLDSKRQVIIPQGMREYYSNEVDSKAYNQLKMLIEDHELWNENGVAEKLISDGAEQNQSPSFLEVIRKENDENVFSNLLGYYFEYSHRSFQKFAANVLNIKDMSATFDLYREYYGETKSRVDLWIENENDIIVIENKIKSGINGIIGDASQLDNYCKLAQKQAAKKNIPRLHYFIFAPEYAKYALSQSALKSGYKIVSYKDIYRFFIDETETYIADRVFPDFLRGLKRHTLTYPEWQFNTMRSRMIRKIHMIHNA